MERTEVPGMNREERLSRWVESYSDAILRIHGVIAIKKGLKCPCFLYLY